MKNRFLLGAALAAAAVLGANTVAPTMSGPPPTAPTAKPGRTATPTPERQAPQKQAPAPVTQRVTLRPQPTPELFQAVRWVEKPHLRKVKYGKRRWVMV